MYEYLEEHAYISKNKKSNYQFELTRERAECIANKYNSLCEEKDAEIESLNNIINKLEKDIKNLYTYGIKNNAEQRDYLLNRLEELKEYKGSDK